MRHHSFVLVLNVVSILILFLLLSSSLHVESLRHLKDHESSSSSSLIKGINLSKAYSGPSHSGRGH
ncbi:hypothetical protein SLEP1_g50520 [Rubroshorea leprosula]|uniref:Transmembrane protein n=1 Tax=Rubroshorea leprosula TaxID=152421 RepID=A0AAV5M184_9ROSI|nr:hypothetical protein SLEP1_g50520 [Rubroshorea leprosula]